MSELTKAFSKIIANPDLDHVLALVIDTEGSVPQTSGAAMLVSADGKTSGTIGGGKMEYECILKCRQMFGSNTADIHSFHMNHPYDRDGGPICGGTIKIFMTNKITAADQNIINAVNFNEQNRAFYFSVNINKNSAEFGKISCSKKEIKGDTTHFVKYVKPNKKVFVSGAGHCGLAIADLLDWLGLDVFLVDERNIEQAKKFSFFKNMSFRTFLNLTKIDDNVAIVLVNKGHKEDAQALELCINSSAKYIGMIGSKRKIELLKKDFIDKGLATEDSWKKLYAPIGLDLDAFEVKEIALSVAAEITAVFNDKEPLIRHRKMS
jgi:xanthine dehydrogenase accessory factor